MTSLTGVYNLSTIAVASDLQQLHHRHIIYARHINSNERYNLQAMQPMHTPPPLLTHLQIDLTSYDECEHIRQWNNRWCALWDSMGCLHLCA